MPSYPCRHPTCTNYVRRRGGYCEEHQEKSTDDRRERDRIYDQYRRNPEFKAFYDSAAWRHVRKLKLARDPVCERCRHEWAEHVHHRIPLERCTIAQRLDLDNLKSLGAGCHSIEEAELRSLNAQAEGR